MRYFYPDIFGDYILFAVQCSSADGAKTDPTAYSLAVYEIDGSVATIAGTAITGSPFTPAQIASKTGLWAAKISKTAFTVGKQYLFVWEMTVAGITAAKQEIWCAVNAASFKADVSGLSIFDPATDTVIVSNTEACKADISGVTSGLAALTGRLTDVRAGYLDNLNITSGAIATTAITDGLALEETSQLILSEIEQAVLTQTNITFVADSVAVNAGTPAGLITNTNTHDETYYSVAAASNAIDFEVDFNIGLQRSPVSLTVHGRLVEGIAPFEDSIDIYAYNYNTLSYDHVSPISGDFVHSTDDVIKSVNFNQYHVSDTGNVKVKFSGASLDTATAFYIDYIYVEAAINTAVFATYDQADTILSITTEARLSKLDVTGTLANTDNADAFKEACPEAVVDLSGVPADVWGYTDKTVNIGSVNNVSVSGPGDFKADFSGLPGLIWDYSERGITEPVTVGYVGATPVTSPDDFKADVSALVPSGSRILTVQFYETGTTTPVPDVRVSVRAGGVLLFSGYSDAAGIFRMAINDGDYQVLAYQAWYVFAPVDVTVSGDTSITVYGDTQAESVPAPDHASDCRVSVPLASYSGAGRLTEEDISNAYARIKVLPLNVGGRYYSGQQIPASWDDTRQEIYWEIVQGATVYIHVPLHNIRKEVVLPESAFYEVGED